MRVKNFQDENTTKRTPVRGHDVVWVKTWVIKAVDNAQHHSAKSMSRCLPTRIANTVALSTKSPCASGCTSPGEGEMEGAIVGDGVGPGDGTGVGDVVGAMRV